MGKQLEFLPLPHYIHSKEVNIAAHRLIPGLESMILDGSSNQDYLYGWNDCILTLAQVVANFDYIDNEHFKDNLEIILSNPNCLIHNREILKLTEVK